MRDIVLITSFDRPQCLRLCREYLDKAGVQDKAVWICHDDRKHGYHGNTYNTMEAYKRAYETDARYVYLVEDDVLVMPDFFQWHEALQEQGDFMCTLAYRCHRNPHVRQDVIDPTAYLTSREDYASIGVCWKRENLAPVVAHASARYYGCMDSYMLQRFPHHPFGGDFSEQDGLIMRVLKETQGVTAWSYLPRAFHIGLWGYNRPNGRQLSLQELRNTIHDAAAIRKANTYHQDLKDIEPVPTSPTLAWDKKDLHRIQEF